MKRIFQKLSVLVLGATFILAGCSTGDGTSGNKFIVGMECAYAPYNWTTTTETATSIDVGDGQYCDGFDVMVARKIAEGLGKELVVQKTAWDGLIPALQSNQIDAIIAGMSPTPERREEVAFSDIYYRGKFGIVVKKDTAYANGTTVNDFAGAKFTAQLGTFHVDLLTQFNGATALPPMKDFPTMTVAAKSGEIDGFVSDDLTGPTIDAENNDLKFIVLDGADGLKVSGDQTGVAVGLRKDDTAVVADINKILANITEAELNQFMEDATARQQ